MAVAENLLLSITDSTSLADAHDEYAALDLRPIPIWGVNLATRSSERPDEFGCACPKGVDCPHPGKHPIDSEWQKASPKNPDAIRAQIARLKLPPNVGLAMGRQPSKKYLLALDVDDADRFDHVKNELGSVPETLGFRSARGPKFIFELAAHHDPSLLTKNITGLSLEGEPKKVPGLDVKIEGGQIVVAPSLHAKGVRYSTIPGPIATLPDAWFDAFVAHPKRVVATPITHAPSVAKVIEFSGSGNQPWLAATIRAVCAELLATPKGGRNDQLFECACNLIRKARGSGVPNGVTIALRELERAARECGLTLSEIRKTIASAKTSVDATGEVVGPQSRSVSSPHSRVSEIFDDAPHAPRFVITPSAELWAPQPPIPYVIDPLFPRGSLALLVAFGSSLKTWLALAAAQATARGSVFLDRYQATQGPALIVDWENGKFELSRRIQQLSPEPIDGLDAVIMPPFFFNSPDFEPILRKLATGRSLLEFDTLTAGTSDGDENDASFARGLQTAKRVAEETGCCILVLHHSRKTGSNGIGDERESVRGSGAIFAAADVVLHLRKHERGAMVLSQSKSRSGKAIEELIVRLDDVHVGGRLTAVLSSAPLVAETGADQSEGAGSVENMKGAIIALLADDHHIPSMNELTKRLGRQKKTVSKALTDLQKSGLVVHHQKVLRLASEVKK